jgi:hypothetical protein
VEVTLSPDGDGTRPRLVHRDLPESERDSMTGLGRRLMRPAAVATGGDTAV